MAGEHFPNDSKTVDVATRAFHRINAPNYDTAVDADPNRRGAKRAPSGRARESGARGPDAFRDSGFLANVTNLVAKLLKPLLALIPVVGLVILAVDAFLKRITGTSPIDVLINELGKLISSGVEGALFARYLRSIPSWVPVGRRGYDLAQFRYEEDGAPRQASREEEREIEGVLTGSYGLSNDTVFTQWSHFRHWSFQVLPAPGFRYLIGAGNVPDPKEREFINRSETTSNSEKFTEILRIYGQNPRGDPASPGAIECVMDVGAISKPVGDRGTHGVMFNPQWPYWPMTGDHFWAAGRWAYDCMRATGSDINETFPTQINPIKAFASSRFEGFKFAENASGVPAVRFFFFATSEGGYTEFRRSTDRNGKTHESGITLGARDYEFVVDLPPHELGRSPYPIGATINFPLNRIVLRPRLLMFVRQAPFDITGAAGAPFADELEFVPIVPKIDILRPADPLRRPQQVRITIPLSKLPKPQDPSKHQAVGIDIALGWHDPTGDDAKKLFKVTAQIRLPAFFSQSGTVRLATAINGRWSMLAERVSEAPGEPGQSLPARPNPRTIHEVEMFLPVDAPVSVTSSGTWLHGFGQFIEENTLLNRRLFVGGLLIDVNAETKRRMQAAIDSLRKTIDDLRKTAADVSNPKEVLRRELQKQLDELRRTSGGDPKAAPAIKALEDQINALVNGLPDTPDGLKAALGDLDKRLADMLDGLGALEDFFKITEDLIGERHFPGWHDDIDAALKEGLEESKRVSAIARSMFLHPTPFINKADEPMGWAEFIDTARTPIGRDPIGALLAPNPLRFANVQRLLDLQQSSGQATTRIRLVAPRFTSVGSGNNLAQQIQPPPERTDYDFELRVTIVPQGT